MSSVTAAAPQVGSGNVTAAQSVNQERLMDFCRSQGIRTPTFQIVSDRRGKALANPCGCVERKNAKLTWGPKGGRTAWSCVVTIQGYAPFPARFWYDGQYVNNAREDAAEKALQMLGILPAPPGLQPAHLRQQQQQPAQQQ